MNVDIPQNVKVEVKGEQVVTTGSLGTNTRTYNNVLLSVKVSGNTIEIIPSTEKKLVRKASNVVNTLAKELKNDMEGVTKHYERHMTAVFAHFPMVVESKGKEVVIKNMQGERDTRRANIIGLTKVEIKGQAVRIYGPSLDDVSQTAANIRVACRIRKKDHRIFQDGIYHNVEKR